MKEVQNSAVSEYNQKHHILLVTIWSCMIVYLMHISLVEIVQCDHVQRTTVSFTACETTDKTKKYTIVIKNCSAAIFSETLYVTHEFNHYISSLSINTSCSLYTVLNSARFPLKGPFTLSISVNAELTLWRHLWHSSHWNQWKQIESLQNGVATHFEQLHSLQCELCRKQHSSIDAVLTLMSGATRALKQRRFYGITLGKWTVNEPLGCIHMEPKRTRKRKFSLISAAFLYEQHIKFSTNMFRTDVATCKRTLRGWSL